MSVQLIPYFVMNGNAREAIEFYVKALDGNVLFSQTFGDMPESPDFPIPAEAKDRITHATIQVGESQLMFSDTFPGQPHQIGNQVTVCISTDSLEKSQRIFEALKEGGQVSMPFQKTFFSPGYAVVTDKFGVTFQINTENGCLE
ncbi:VOC family protein [Brevibacillus sp. TJ4]|uniref:VOC family protein n=1 Tax=Brevibacillus sp. TJ4 TaxID=3234853 RepID=UPI0037D40B8D